MEAFTGWLTVNRGRSEGTAGVYRRHVERFANWMDGPPGSASAQDVARFLVALVAAGAARNTGVLAHTALRQYFKFLRDSGLVDDNPASQVPGRQLEQRPARSLSVLQVQMLLDNPDRSTPVGARDAALLEVLYGCGLRASELTGLLLDDVDMAEQVLRVTGKGNKERLLPIGKQAVDALTRWLTGDTRKQFLDASPVPNITYDGANVFPNGAGRRMDNLTLERLVLRHAEQAGLEVRVHPHMLRHSCATHMVEGGAEVQVLQRFLGHVDINSTQRYINVGEERLLRVYHETHPHGSANQANPQLPGT